MCTVSWMHTGSGYRLYCNRDEKVTRPAAIAPREYITRGVRFVAPLDAAFGGAWITANESGVSLCLLNGAVVTGRRGTDGRNGTQSRGHLVMELACANSAADVSARLARIDLTPFADFTLAILEPLLEVQLAEWDGESCTVLSSGERYLPLASSSYDSDGVRRIRPEQLKGFRGCGTGINPELLRQFHLSHADGPGAYSPCMHRADAKTVSFTSVCVEDGSIDLSYQPGSPCEEQPEETVTLCCNFC
jgi:hypothetical protein